MLDMARTREVFEGSTDFTLAVEEEFQLLDPESLDQAQRYTELRAAADQDPVLADAVAGELIESEIEIRSGRAESWAEMAASQREARARLFRLAADTGIQLGATATHPWSPWQEQKIIDTDHYRRVADGL
jgi:carboxylate-amine ligase